jgi:hypothetical protein
MFGGTRAQKCPSEIASISIKGNMIEKAERNISPNWAKP